LAWSCSTTKYGVELIQYILILKWGITRVSLLVLHGSDTKETKYGIWLILYKLGRSWILICTWIKYYCTNKNNVLSISAFHRQAWKLFECQRWVNYYCLTNNNKWWFNPWIDLGRWRNKCGPYIYRSVRIVAGTDHHWNHLFFGYCPLFWDKDMWDKWFGENKKMRWWFFYLPRVSYYCWRPTYQPTEMKNRTYTYQVITGSKLGASCPTLKNQIIHMVICRKQLVHGKYFICLLFIHTVMSCIQSLWEGTLHAEGVYLTQKHESVAEVIFTTYIRDGVP
jgi:hypothetical protein